MLRTAIISILLGLTFFALLMGAALGLITLNATLTPNVAWFPLPVTVLLVVALWLAQRYWGIGLDAPLRTLQPRVYAVAAGVTLLGMAACAVQGKFSGYVRATERYEANVGAAFEFTYAIYMAVFAAVLAEATFRGIIQTRLQSVLSVWPVVILIGLINVFAHRWGPEITHNGLGLFVVLAGWTWLRWWSQSLWPPLVMHTLVNLLVGLGLWYGGPLEHRAVPGEIVLVIALIGIAGLGIALALRGPRNA